MKKIKSVFVLLLSLNHGLFNSMSYAQASTVGVKFNVKELILDIQYQLSVEWDGVDQNKYHQIFNRFQSELEALKSQGLTKEELDQSMLELIENQNAKDEMKSILETLSLDSDLEQKQQVYFTQLQNAQPTGSHWAGNVDSKRMMWISLGTIAGVAYFTYGGYCIFHPARGTNQEPQMCVPLTNFFDRL